ncbi:multicopper oxidase domain-containing protein [sulfur-oxidizing endosymbiont of Gigantopelta aegis]|uniref:multicopper oxidase domain-containing protein n=1 Tax=sulfur-oxidizing endosymbiont of Gigantopelta aegis TaxID=2794934 RepID=UPI0018DC7DD9|nr:multicopper oxidase domain-containing protein [sulfur-oxidizing endosymbiont of Gigantopelta aegis]
MFSSTGLLSWTARAHAATIAKTFYITEGTITQPDGVDVYFRGYSENSSSLNVPGAQLIVQEGDTVAITIVNLLSTDHSFVIDGVIDSGVIAAGTTVNFEFVAMNVGTQMYYDALNAPYNRLVGLHGCLAVMPSGSDNEVYAGSPTFVQQYSWITNDIDSIWHNAISNGNTPTSAFKPNYFTLNGQSMRVPGHPDYKNPDIDSGYAPDTRLVGSIGDRTLVRIQNAGLCSHSMHFHANHVEWLTRNGTIRDDVWLKDTLYLPNNIGSLDVIYPFETPPDAWPPVTKGHFPMHSHDEMTQTAGGGSYQFGLATTISFE